jgi:hypothetical protein
MFLVVHCLRLFREKSSLLQDFLFTYSSALLPLGCAAVRVVQKVRFCVWTKEVPSKISKALTMMTIDKNYIVQHFEDIVRGISTEKAGLSQPIDIYASSTV